MDDYSDEVLQKTQNQIEEWCDAFSETDLFKSLDESVQEELWFIAPVFSEYMYNYHLQTPENWTAAALEEVITDLFPRKITADENTFASVEPVLTAFFQYLGDMVHIKKSSILIKTLKRAAPVMLKQSNDSSTWGPSKQFAMAAMKNGVDLEDEQALHKFMDIYNAERKLKPTISSPKIGRNELCPCGSGKKHKKCCGA